MMRLGTKLASPQGHKFVKEERRVTSKFFFSETARRRALISGMLRLLVDPYQVCLYDVPGIETGPAPGGGGDGGVLTSLNKGTKKDNFKILPL